MSNEYKKESALSDGQDYESLFKLNATACKLVMDGKRLPGELSELLQQFIGRQEKKDKDIHPRSVQLLTLAPTKGDVMLAEAEELFSGFLDNDLKNWGTNRPGPDTKAETVESHLVSRDLAFTALIGLIKADPDLFCLTQGQIIEFCCTHREHLQQNSYGTLFPFAVGQELFVALVHAESRLLNVSVNRMGNDRVWSAGSRRIVVRQQSD